MKKGVVLGAGGKMGYRVSANLRGAPYEVSHVEVSDVGCARLQVLLDCSPAMALAVFSMGCKRSTR